MIRFSLLPLLDQMIALYEQPRNFERFEKYILLLQGDTKGDLAVPISGFNPMGKEHVLEGLKRLKDLGLEEIMAATLKTVRIPPLIPSSNREFKVAFNLSDDLMGGWTNRYTSDFDSKFKLNSLVNRNFCTPIFWTSESFTKDLIEERTQAAVFRTLYWLYHPKPKTLKEHLDQEVFVAQHTASNSIGKPERFESLIHFYQEYQHSENYPILFNFFYGDAAAASLGFPTYGHINVVTGFHFAAASCQAH